MPKRILATYGVRLREELRQPARPPRSAPQAERTSCFPREQMSRASRPQVGAEPCISNKRRERQFPKCCADQGGCAAPLHAALGHGSTRAGSVRAMQLESMLHPTVAAGARFPGSAYFSPQGSRPHRKRRIRRAPSCANGADARGNRGEVGRQFGRSRTHRSRITPNQKRKGSAPNSGDAPPIVRRAKSGRPGFRSLR